MEFVKKAIERDTSIDLETMSAVSKIIEDVRQRKDEALWEYTERFDGSTRRLENLGLRVTPEEIQEAYKEVDPASIKDMAQAAMNILAFAEAQKMSMQEVHDFSPKKGIYLGHRIIPIDSCLCYVPGGNYPLYSTALMLIIPAKEAGVGRVIACSPVEKGTNRINPKTLVAMDIAGADEIYAIGGTQAIAAAAYGTESIEPVDLIVGPGNKYVAEAKRQCYGQVGIDFVAGPSEVLIIADGSGSPEIVAADLLAQAEHDVNAKSILIAVNDTSVKSKVERSERIRSDKEDYDESNTDGANAGDLNNDIELNIENNKKAEDFAHAVMDAVEKELESLATVDIARVSWENNGEVLIAESFDEAIEYSNKLAPEHLELNMVPETPDINKVGLSGESFEDNSYSEKVEYLMNKLRNYGSLFIGQNTAEVFGDYASGPNHTLPTVRASRYTGGLWVGTFLKTCAYQYMTDEGSEEIAPVVRRLAEGEGLSGHALAAKLREK